jgi:hypothetical protein
MFCLRDGSSRNGGVSAKQALMPRATLLLKGISFTPRLKTQKIKIFP